MVKEVLRNKKAQAFLVSAVMIIVVLAALIAVSNFSKRKSFSNFPLIAEQLQIESEKVMDYALENNKWQDVSKFTQDFSAYAGSNIKIYFIENTPGPKCYYWENSVKFSCANAFDSNSLTLNIDGVDYDFQEYSEGKHFYFVMISEEGGEKYIYANS